MSTLLPTLECVTVPIPAEVADFMQVVWSLIESHDETVEQVNDDLIQAPNIAPIIGGIDDLNDLKAKRFRFCYTACDDPVTRWHLYLFDNEIEDIAKRRVTSLTLWKCAKSTCRHLFKYKRHVYCDCHP